MRFLRETVLNNVDASILQVSAPIDASQMVTASLQVIITGTAVGVVQFQFSNDAAFSPPNTQQPVNWYKVADTTLTITTPGVFSIPKVDISYQWLRVIYTPTSGTGTLTCSIKTINY